MKPERWQQLDELFHSALEREPEERAAFLDEVCANDSALRREVEALLTAHNEAGSFIEKPALEVEARSLANEHDSTDASLIGQTIGHYKILAPLGMGGMGEVYLAQDMRLSRHIALKLLPTDYTKDADRLHRFEQEARAASALNHPNIITIHEIGQFENRYFIAIEYIEGTTLRERLTEKGMKLMEALDVAVQVASALAAAHTKGIVHRDIKPENVMLRSDGYVKVLDFGLAKLTEGIAERQAIDLEAPTRGVVKTASGMVIGTVQYMSPEQARGLEVDARTDIWSLGCVLYEMVAGRAPFEGATNSDVIVSLLEREPPPLARFTTEVPTELQRIVTKALNKDKEQRYQVIKDLLLDLKTLKQEVEFEAKLEQSDFSSGGPPIQRSGGSGRSRLSTGNLQVGRPTVRGESLLYQLRSHPGGAVLAVAALLIAVAAIAYFSRSHQRSSNRTGSSKTFNAIAVLPFANASGDPNREYISDGITENINNSLSQLPQLRVMARVTTFRYKGREIDPQKVGRELGVDAVLMGKVTEIADNLTIQADLIDVADGSQIWGERYDRKLSDILTVQSEIAKTISDKLRLKLTGEQEKLLNRRYTNNVEAYQLYLKGRYYWNKLTDDGLKKSVEYFSQVLGKDPNYALAHSGLADAYIVMGLGLAPPREVFPQAKIAAARALELDETLAAAHISMGAYKLFYEWDWPGAESEARRAKELNPSYAKVIELNTNYGDSNHFYCQYLDVIGRPDESIVEIKRALELDPLSINMNMELGNSLYIAHRYDESLAQCQKALEMDPGFVYGAICVGQAAEQKGEYEKAIVALSKTRVIAGDETALVSELGYAYALAGKKIEAQKIIRKLKERAAQRFIDPYAVALIYIGLGNKDQAFEWLEKAYKERSPGLTWLKVEPKFDPLRPDRRFADLMHRVGFTS